MGNTPPWLISRVLSVIVAVIGAVPLLAALLKGEAHATTVIDQCAASVIVLWVYLMIARAALPPAAFQLPPEYVISL